jgi:hypothetical protein
LEAPTPVALQLQRPLPDDALVIVAKGSRQDGGDVPPPVDSVASKVETIKRGGLYCDLVNLSAPNDLVQRHLRGTRAAQVAIALPTEPRAPDRYYLAETPRSLTLVEINQAS